MLNLYIIYSFIAFTLVLNLKPLLSSGKKLSTREKWLYFYVFMSIMLWAICNALSDILKNYDQAIFFARVSVLFPLNIINSLLQIVRNFPKTINKPQSYKLFKVINITTIAFTVMSLFLLNFSVNLQNFAISLDGPADFTPGFLYTAIVVIAVLILVFILYFWQKNLKSYTRIQRRQILSILTVFFFVYFSMSLGLVVFPLQGLSTYSPFMFLSLSLLLFILNKNLWVKYAVVDMQEAILKLGGLLVGTLVLFVLIDAMGIVDVNLNVISQFLILFIVVSIISQVNSGFQGIYKKRGEELRLKINEFIEESTMQLSVDEIYKSLKQKLVGLLNTENIELKIFDFHNKTNVETDLEKWWKLRSSTPLINKEILIESYFDKENNKEVTKWLFSYFQENNIDVLIPISNRKDLTGLIYIKKSGKVLNESDYNALELLSNSVSVSISRALMYQEVQDFNKSLQSKVDIQTKELQTTVKELQAARKKEADMIDIMGHELRTPATVVKLNAELLSQFTGKVTQDPDKFRKYLDRIKIAVEDEIKLINTLLSSAKLEGNKIVINPEEIDIAMEIEMSMHAHEQMAKEKGLEFTSDVEKDLSTIYADKARVIEVLNNLISNAVKYTPEGSVKVIAKDFGSMVQVVIADTGEGISKEDMANLGQKFYRVTNYIKSKDSDNFDIVRPGGTGLGLYVTFNLIKKMGGEIKVESEVGKGSKFIFTLPKFVGQKSKMAHNESNDMFERLGLKK